MTRKKKPLSWRTCPACKSRATKLYSMNTGKYRCQLCGTEYEYPHSLIISVEDH